MPVHYVSGDPLLTDCQTLAIGHNRIGRTETSSLSTKLRQAYRTAYSGYERRCKQNRQASGEVYLWTESKPQLLFLTVRDSAVGATRLRHVQTCLMTIARDYHLYNIETLAITLMAHPHELADIKTLFTTWLTKSTLEVTVYESYLAGKRIEGRR